MIDCIFCRKFLPPATDDEKEAIKSTDATAQHEDNEKQHIRFISVAKTLVEPSNLNNTENKQFTMSSQSESEEFNDEGASRPIPSFDSSAIKLTTIAPALGVADDSPDYLEYEDGYNLNTNRRGTTTVMFANAGLSYMLGTLGGGLYGFQEGLKKTPSNRLKVKVNSVLNHSSRHGSRVGNMFGVLSVFYSLYEATGDYVSLSVADMKECFHILWIDSRQFYFNYHTKTMQMRK